MARGTFSGSNYLLYGSALLTAAPVSMACWFNTPTLSNAALVTLSNSGSSNFNNLLCLNLISTAAGLATAATTGANSAQTSGGVYTTNTWVHAAGVFASDASRAVYINGGNKATNGASRVPIGIDRTVIGATANANNFRPFNGLIAEVGIWNAALTDADVVSLAAGFSPALIRPDALVGYWPLLGNNSPENNLRSNVATMAIQGSLSRAAHPRVFMPH